MDYDTLQQAFLAFRRANGAEDARALIAKHGGDITLSSVPESNWQALHADFKGGAPSNMQTNACTPKTLDEIAPAAFKRFNNPARNRAS